MIDRRSLMLAAGAAAIVAARPASATGQRFTQAAFDAAQAAGKPILVEVTAPWCPTCRAQQPILQKLTAEPRFRDLIFLSVDFDSQKDVVRALNVRSQSTLVVFKGRAEVGRSAGDTNAESIAALVAKSI
ncbi:thioredoxin family protein [Phreatobacter sp.]|uniref:thioredoxin family protein n=1 Tax=Phreatobacter sp. TaxID=1966341 RepID=UPI0022BC7A67|nr:thioredoxin family protein [Phreatobacter sp.]MCZ8313619.1 thioredoxin family protein [Phreatobacter sp.]